MKRCPYHGIFQCVKSGRASARSIPAWMPLLEALLQSNVLRFIRVLNDQDLQSQIRRLG